MTIFKTMVLAALLAAPMMASAITTTATATIGSGGAVDNAILNGTNTAQVHYETFMEPLAVNDSWDLDIGANEMASISFTNVTFGVVLNIGGFLVDNGTTYVFNGLTTDRTFSISGMADGWFGGGYTVAMTAIPAAVPVPAAVWLMVSAMVGLFSFRKRKATLAA